MIIEEVSVPEIYTTSADFRFFMKWFETALSKIHFDTENLADIYDPLKCPKELLWMLADTMGYKYDDRPGLSAAFNRLVLMYFMSMIRNRGSKDGITLAAEVNLAQFNLQQYGEENPILFNRLEDTSIPVNSVYVTPHTAQGYIDVVYFRLDTQDPSDLPVDACIEYVRPVGMYVFAQTGLRLDARTKISVDARLTDTANVGMSIGPTHVGHYSREDYATMQKMKDGDKQKIDTNHKRQAVYYRNSENEPNPPSGINKDVSPGYRALYSLQMSNNEHIFESLLKPIFGIRYGPQDVGEYVADSYVIPEVSDGAQSYNLGYDRVREEAIGTDVYTAEADRTVSAIKPRPAVNPIMGSVGDAISLNPENTKYSMNDSGGRPKSNKASRDGKLQEE